jgi:DNA-binding beta-propeller fold protein YncE
VDEQPHSNPWETNLSLQFLHFIELPEHVKPGGFDHAAIHRTSRRLYVAHTINDALDVIDCVSDQYLYSIPGLAGVAGALVSDERNLVFTSNRGEDTVGIFSPEDGDNIVKVSVGVHPNGLSFDSQRGLLLAANVGSPDIPGSFTLSIVDIQCQEMIHSIPVPGRTRWTVFDAQSDAFYVNIADPAQIVIVNAVQPNHVAKALAIPAAGPHGLDLDIDNRLLFCACDAGKLIVMDLATGSIQGEAGLSGTPDVIFYNPLFKHLYVAIGDPGVMDVFDTKSLAKLETVPTEKGAHTLAFDVRHNKVYAFLPQTHRAQVFADD